MTRGIPPAPDRVQFERFAAVVAAFVAVLGLSGLMLAVRGCEFEAPAGIMGVRPETGAETWPGEQSAEGEAERERLSAYMAVQSFIENALKEDLVRTIHWRENTHAANGGVFTFQGEADLEYTDGYQEHVTYLVIVNKTPRGGWGLIEMTVGERRLYPRAY